MTDKERFARAFGYLCLAFEKGPATKERTAMYDRFLRDIPIGRIEKAVTKIIKTRKYSSIPQVAEIREVALELEAPALEARAAEAWAIAERAIATREAVDGITDSAIRLAFGGWANFGQTSPGYDGDRRRFVEAYKNIATRAAAGAALEQHLEPPALPPGDSNGKGEAHE